MPSETQVTSERRTCEFCHRFTGNDEPGEMCFTCVQKLHDAICSVFYEGPRPFEKFLAAMSGQELRYGPTSAYLTHRIPHLDNAGTVDPGPGGYYIEAVHDNGVIIATVDPVPRWILAAERAAGFDSEDAYWHEGKSPLVTNDMIASVARMEVE